ncbi:MAG: NAD-dependent malic enzyme [Gammaproteobacteria bacterium]
MDYEFAEDENGKPYLKVAVSDLALISNPILNKGMAFSERERAEFGLTGIIPPFQTNIQIQLARSYEFYQSKPSDIEKYIYLRDLQDSNETLFYRLLLEHIEEMLPIVYTPTVGLGCQRYSHIYRRPRGVFISYPDRHHIEKILANPRFDNVTTIVVSDGERILGLGDQGAGGMGIPIGKLALYSACAGIHPASTLPVLLDTGTNNPDLINDPLYIGWHHERIRGKEYDKFIEDFVTTIKKRFPHVLLQWEDFAQQNANPILSRYRNELCTFNDDIQGTAAIAAGTLFAAIHVTGNPLREQRIVVVGAGSAGCGISNLIKKAMVQEGLSESEAGKHFFLIDREGLLLDDAPSLLFFQKPFAQPKSLISHWKLQNPAQISLADVVKNVHPTLLIGVSGQSGIFTKKIVEDMAAHVERPIIFPLSNPTTCAEATPADLMEWTQHRAIIGTGSPFANVIKLGRSCRIDQTNNSYIFPGVGLGLIAVKAKHVTDKMFMIAALALSECSPAKKNPDANLLPPLTDIRQVSFQIALAVAEEAIKANLANFKPSIPLAEYIKKLMWVPEYLTYRKWTR